MSHPSWCDLPRCTSGSPDGVHKGVVHVVRDAGGRELLRWFLQAGNGRVRVLLAATPSGSLDDGAAARFVEGARVMVIALSEAQAGP